MINHSDNPSIRATQTWLNTVIIQYQLCPFAKREQKLSRIYFHLNEQSDLESCLINLITECNRLTQDESIETTLLIYPHAFKVFDDYLDFVALAEDLVIEQGYEGIYQLASFHPEYCFAECDTNDPANYTNRSPYPMLHLLRESSIEKAVSTYPNPESIPQRNINVTRQLGLAKMQTLLAACYAKV